MKKTPLKQVSSDRVRELRAYYGLRKLYLSSHPYCEMSIGCLNPATQIHHERGRWGKWLNRMEFWKSSCDSCHKQHPGPSWDLIRQQDRERITHND